ncbi:MAG: LarC family nickel insertion protein [Candidatus Rokubacteria bacterium]|nr:LarC family nickel insertion protein [Candidatus Rokubacteria bacterium]
MKLAYFDCPSGAAGDMILGALVDAGCPLELLRAELAKVEVHGYEISASEVRRAGFRGMKMEVAVEPHSQSHRRLPEILSELVTPTGAAILTTLAEGAGSLPPMRLEAVGLGAGSWELPIPNFVRLLLGESDAPLSEEAVEPLTMLETTLDDMTPQLFEPLMERLLEGGAVDVYLTPVIMKRSRPGVVLTVSCLPDRVRILTDLIFQETTTLGVRWREHRRVRLARELVRLPTSHGSLTFKVARRGGRVVQVSPEFEEVRRLARERGLPLRALIEQLRQDGWAAFRDSP